MRRIDCGMSGSATSRVQLRWQDLQLDPPWPGVIDILSPGTSPRMVQAQALGEQRLFASRRHLILSAPTNSGKSLVGLLALLEVIQRGRRAILLEPLRALARERMAWLDTIVPRLGQALGRPFSVRISTGDYRLDEETFAAPPPQHGELIIATPERFEAIMRNPAYDDWIASIEAVCVDEAHLLGSAHRGPTLEYLLTSLLCLPLPPRLLLLSATLGNVDRVQAWLDPCDVIQVTERYPSLQKEVFALAPDDNANAVVQQCAHEWLADPTANLLIFVYQTRAAESLARFLRETVGEQAGCAGVLAYHGQMSPSHRETVRTAFCSGQSRCLVATTALGLGVNLPATHVVIRDNTFAGVGPLSAAELLQMMGRAGRGERPGHAVVLIRPHDVWSVEALARTLSEETLPVLESPLQQSLAQRGHRVSHAELDLRTFATHVAVQLSRHEETGLCADDLQHFFARSLGGAPLARYVHQALTWLTDPLRALAFTDEYERYHLTVLGLKVVRAVLPVHIASGYAQLLRDLLSIDASDRLLAGWQPLDHMIVLHLLTDYAPPLRAFSAALCDQVEAWIETIPTHTPILYREWIAGAQETSRAMEIMGSLGLTPPGKVGHTESWVYKAAYMAVFRAIMLYERGQGKEVTALERRWKIKDLEGVEERWRDALLWLLAGVAQMLDVRCFYFHLREACAADTARIRRVKQAFQRMRAQVFDLQDHLKYCSPLGPVLHSLRRTRLATPGPSVGVQTIRHLEEAGIHSVAELAGLHVDALVQLGIRRHLVKQLYTYVRRRLQ